MARRLLLDTGVIAAAQRRRLRMPDLVSADDDIAVASVTIAELRVGELNAAGRKREAMEDYRRVSLVSVAVLDYTESTALIHAELLHHARSTGKTRGAHDLIIAATAKETDRLLVTTDTRADFADLPGVKVLVVPTDE